MATIEHIGNDGVTSRTLSRTDWHSVLMFDWQGHTYDVCGTHRENFIGIRKDGTEVGWYTLRYGEDWLFKVNKTCITSMCSGSEFVQNLYKCSLGNNRLAMFCNVVLGNVRKRREPNYDGRFDPFSNVIFGD